MQKALDGIKILEIGDELTQFAGKMLADMGAEVIKVEPKEGVESRHIGPFYKDESNVEKSLYFWHYNTSKKSIILDLYQEEDRNKFHNLLSEFDVILDDFKPAQLKEWKLDFENLSKQYPDLIMCSITSFGQYGPWSDFKMSDLTHLALGGVMAVNGYDDVEDTPPIAPTGGQAANTAAYFAAIGVMSALFYRDFGAGKGQHVDISVHDCLSASTEYSLPYWEYQDSHVKRQTVRHALPHETTKWLFECKDGGYVLCLNTYLDAKRWRELVKWLDENGIAGELTDERYVESNFRAENMHKVTEALEVLCKLYDANDIYHHAQSLNIPWAEVRAPEEMLDDPHLTEDRKAFVEVNHPELGKTFTYPGAPYKFKETPWEISRAPLLGEHDEEVKSQYVTASFPNS